MRCQLLDVGANGEVIAFAEGAWRRAHNGQWAVLSELAQGNATEFVFADPKGRPAKVDVAWTDVLEIHRNMGYVWVRTPSALVQWTDGQPARLEMPRDTRIRQMASGPDGVLHLATDRGLVRAKGGAWTEVPISDPVGRRWDQGMVTGVAFDSRGGLWIGTPAGVVEKAAGETRFFEGKDGLPFNDFTGFATGPSNEVWMGTTRGVIRRDSTGWHYRQGSRWLPEDRVEQVAVDSAGTAWLRTANGVGSIEFKPMALQQKAEFYEQEIERFIKRTPMGYVSEARLKVPADKSSADPDDSDNDGLWTAMYGAGECFAFGATRNPAALRRARQAFEALRFLQVVTEGGSPAPPKGYIARTIRSTSLPDPNIGRLEADKRDKETNDRLWKIYEPRWPRSADGKWFWKSDTSSDELDGHYFFYPLFYDLCADAAERERVKEVVTGITDHLIQHDFTLVDHDGTPTRWGVYGPQYLNSNTNWWPERGLNSLSILSYLAVAAHITGDPQYDRFSRELVERHGYAQNAMYPKVQNGPGSGNQSDDEMAFMCFYNLVRYSKNESLRTMIRYAFFRYWANELPEMNPFFNFAYAAVSQGATTTNPWGTFSIAPWQGWLEDSRATLYGFPLDRLNWSHHNSHRIDLLPLWPQGATDLYDQKGRRRGYRTNGRVVPVENRHFNHWNTDPWTLDYGGNGGELASGAVFLLPYYMGMYHGFIDKPAE